MTAPSTQEEMLGKDGGIPSQKRPNQIIFVFAGWLNKLQPLLLYTHFNMDFCMDDGFYVNNIFLVLYQLTDSLIEMHPMQYIIYEFMFFFLIHL